MYLFYYQGFVSLFCMKFSFLRVVLNGHYYHAISVNWCRMA